MQDKMNLYLTLSFLNLLSWLLTLRQATITKSSDWRVKVES